MSDGEYWIAQHCANPFGSIAAVHAWHRFANLYNDFAVMVFKAPMGRYVDDFFGASNAEVEWHGGKVLECLAELVEVPVDADKSHD